MSREGLFGHDMANMVEKVRGGAYLVAVQLEEILNQDPDRRPLSETLGLAKDVEAQAQEMVHIFSDYRIHEEAEAKYSPLRLSERFEEFNRIQSDIEGAYGIKLVLTHNVPGGCAVHAPPEAAKQLFRLIIENAAKAKAKTVRVHYQCKSEETQVQITFTDDGEGMESEELRGLGMQKPNDELRGGKGIRHIMNLMNEAGGVVSWDSKGPGTGTQVVIKLRRAL